MSQDCIQVARQTYSIDYWSDGYFDINSQGNVVLRVPGQKQLIPLVDVVKQAQAQGLALPLLVRFGSILQDRVKNLCHAFASAMQRYNYDAAYTAVYPIKVNQQRPVVDKIISTSVALPNCQVGLEAGSKPELLAVLALSKPHSTIICNGYKDRAYIRLALIGEKMQRNVFIVVEKRSELDLVLQEANALQVTPRIGVRVRLSTIGEGNWQNSGGEKSKFGLSAAQILEVVDALQAADRLDNLTLLHFHLGSQISNIQDIHRGMKEAARYFAELNHAGAAIRVVDVGGGLGVDYEGTGTRSYCSVNYSMEEYAAAIVLALQEASNQYQLNCPDIITESGRAITAHHAVLIADEIGCESVLDAGVLPIDQDAPPVLQDLKRCYQTLSDCRSQTMALSELYHELGYRLSEAHDIYTYGALSLLQKAQAERFYYASCQLLLARLDKTNRTHLQIFDELSEKLADKLFVNFSLFQSLPDIWGIDQVFPIMPLQSLHQPMARRVVIQDITCDSDGRIDTYVDSGGLSSSLPLPATDPQQPVHLAFFMAGAYQEILGDMHNLFGDTDTVDVNIDAAGNLILNHASKGNTVNDMLAYVDFDGQILLQYLHDHLLQADISKTEQSAYLAELRQGLAGYTYLIG